VVGCCVHSNELSRSLEGSANQLEAVNGVFSLLKEPGSSVSIVSG
jgi:hypothetical protein